ncbi:segregation and condensation protein A [Spiroplasma endosymbiont of Othius punctulatus]|uniref:segregation and condensation protein A n=1 Tax=Spiroplasma endosymbiont of Othius punctulatus TaxID=3066289 RepID=UPI0030D38F86
MSKWNEVKLDNFNGPLDLLLEMIREKNMSIMEINLLELSNQYLDFINSTKDLNIEIASEYLIMAAYLIEIKSKLLIPKEVVEVDSNYEEDQRQELLQRLMEYHKIKEVTKHFKEFQEEGMKLISKEKSIIQIQKIDDMDLPLAPSHIDMDKFSKIFLKLMEKNRLKTPEVNTIQSTEVSPEEMSENIKAFLVKHENKVFLLEDVIFEAVTIQSLIATFLAILDLVRHDWATITQDKDDLYIQWKSVKEEIGD